MGITKNILIGILVIVFALLSNACTVVVKNPTENTHSHTSNSLHYWYYYPNTRVYYHISERYYYYPYGGSWRKAYQLPPGWVLDKAHRVRLRIVGKPYLKHAYHKRKYPPKNVAEHEPNRHDHGNRGNHENRGNGNKRHDHSVPNNKKHRSPNRPVDVADDVAKGRHQAPGQAKSRKVVPPGHAKSMDTPATSHRPNERAVKSQHRNNKPYKGTKQAMEKHPRAKHAEKVEQLKSRQNGKGNASTASKEKSKGGVKQNRNRHETMKTSNRSRLDARETHPGPKDSNKQNHRRQQTKQARQIDKAGDHSIGKPTVKKTSYTKQSATQARKGNAKNSKKSNPKKAGANNQEQTSDNKSEANTEDQVVELKGKKGKAKGKRP
jgi:hypothetical protein